MAEPGATPTSSADPLSSRETRVSPFHGIDVAIILPTLNEEKGLARTLEDIPFDLLRAAGWRIRPLIIDGGSTDGTVNIAKSHGIQVLRQSGRGKGGAIQEALEWLRREDVRFAVVLDADCTYPGEAIGPALCLLAAGSQLVVGIRTPVRTAAKGPREAVHRVGNSILNYFASQLSRHTILDLCSGFWGLDLRSGVDRDVESTGFEIEAELFLKSYLRGLKVSQIPIVYRKRVGEAKLRALHDGARIFLTILRCGRTPRGALPVPLPPSADLLRQLLSIALLDRSNRLVVVTPPSRHVEAREVISHLRGSGVTPQLVVSQSELPLPEVTHHRFAGTLTSNGWSTLVALPSINPSTDPTETQAVVLLPRTGRVVYLGPHLSLPVAGGRAGLPPAPGSIPKSGAYALEFRPGPLSHLRWVTALGAHLDSSSARKELSLLRANGLGTSSSVWRRPSEESEYLDPLSRAQ